mmetsp:Transcript_20076/g.43812  ORF Transcript_20076/g.43812 Transcript_20076/m.43812 type:complete len:592 (-) Transcript_20076:633-2408(-)
MVQRPVSSQVGNMRSVQKIASDSDLMLPCPRREDLELGTLLGQGAFAKVFSAVDLRNDAEYALKRLDKRQVTAKDHKGAVMRERAFLSSFDYSGITRLHYAFQDECFLYFVLEHVAGGELGELMTQMGTCSLDFTRHYAAEIVSTLIYLRAQRVAHRDLKPENILLTADGHLKLVDFDAAIRVPEEPDSDEDDIFSAKPLHDHDASAFVGTALYLPPEVILGHAQIHQAFARDLWALGCIVYQMLVGKTPFQASSESAIFERIVRADVTFSSDSHNDVIDLVVALMAFEPAARLGAGAQGLEELCMHPLFGGSLAAFEELRSQEPLAARGLKGSLSSDSLSESLSDSLSDSLSESLSEGLSEIGQRFSAQDEKIPELLLSDSEDSVHYAKSTASTMSGGSFTVSLRSGKSGLPRSTSGGSWSSWSRSTSSASISPPLSPARTCSSLSLSLPEDSAAEWRSLADLPMYPVHSWMEELVQQNILNLDESIVSCGSVVVRRLSCLRPKVLVLTDLPRLIVLDSTGLQKLYETDFKETDKEAENLINVTSESKFELMISQKRLRCLDDKLGAADWALRIRAAQEQARTNQLADSI